MYDVGLLASQCKNSPSGSVVQGNANRQICEGCESSEADEYSEEDTNTSAGNQSTKTEFVRMSLISRLQQRKQTGKGS